MLGLGDIKRNEGSGGRNKTRHNAFLKSRKSKILKNPTKSIRKLLMNMKVDPKTPSEMLYIPIKFTFGVISDEPRDTY